MGKTLSGARLEDSRASGLLAHLGHILAVLWVFAGCIFQGRLLYFRDIGVYYYPNYVFLERALAQGIWPLWHPACDAGVPFLIADPMDLALVGIGGASWALRFGPPFHLLIAMFGASFLARTLGQGNWGSWVAGSIYGLSGFYLSTVNLFELNHGVSWAPWVVAAFLRLLAVPSARRAATLGVLAAILTSTLAAEVLAQTAALCVFLVPRLPGRRSWVYLAVAGAIAACISAPALLGALALVAGTQRAAGFPTEVALAWSATPTVLMDILLPRFFGDVHAFTNQGFWGQSFFPDGYPYLVSLYLGPAVLLLAARAGRANRLWIPVALGVLLSLGLNGPLAPAVLWLMRSFRTPVKFLFLPVLSLALLAGWGLHRTVRGEGRCSRLALGPGLALLSSGLLLFHHPELPARIFGSLVPALNQARALGVAANAWPGDFAASGLCALLVALSLITGARLAPLAGLVVVLDLLAVGEGLNPATEPTFYSLQPQVQDLLRDVPPGQYRWFAYGFVNAPGLHPSAALAKRNSDVWLYYLDRQSLLPRTHVLDGLEAAFDEDRVGWAPAGSTLTAQERSPLQYARCHRRLWLAGVRFVLSFLPISDERLQQLSATALPELAEPLRLYELVDPLPRAFFVSAYRVVPMAAVRGQTDDSAFDPRALVLLDREPPAPEGRSPGQNVTTRVEYQRLDPHTVEVRAWTPPGFVVVLDGYDESWRAECEGRAVPLLRANGRYWALPTAGGARVFRLRHRPSWRTPALVACAAGLLACVTLICCRRRRT